MFSCQQGQEPLKLAENCNQITGFPGTVKQRDGGHRASNRLGAGTGSEPASTHGARAGSLVVRKTRLEPRKTRKKRAFSASWFPIQETLQRDPGRGRAHSHRARQGPPRSEFGRRKVKKKLVPLLPDSAGQVISRGSRRALSDSGVPLDSQCRQGSSDQAAPSASAGSPRRLAGAKPPQASSSRGRPVRSADESRRGLLG